MSYRGQLNRFKAQTARAGIDRVHGLRHHYAQARYAELTGCEAPAAGGPTARQLSFSAFNCMSVGIKPPTESDNRYRQGI